MTQYTFQIEKDLSLAVVVCENYKRALDIMRSTLLTDLFWLVDEKPSQSTNDSISFRAAE